MRFPRGQRADNRAIRCAGIAGQAQAKFKWVVVMRRYIVVANQTLQGAELRKELHKRVEAGSSSFYVLVPNTSAPNYRVVPAAGGIIPMPSTVMDYGAPTDEEATAQARGRLSQVLADLAALGVPVEGDLGSSHPLQAMEKVFMDHQFASVFFFGMSWGPVVWVLLGEMFNNRIRAIALSVAATAQWISNWIVSVSFPYLKDVGLGLAYGLYTTATLLSLVFVLKWVKETKGRELESM
jgi:Sugar (and other) transporter